MFARGTADNIEHFAEEGVQAGKFLFEARTGSWVHFAVAVQLAASGFLEERQMLDKHRLDRAHRRTGRTVQSDLVSDAVQLSGHAIEKRTEALLIIGTEVVLDGDEDAGRGIDPAVDFGEHVFEATQEGSQDAAVRVSEGQV